MLLVDIWNVFNITELVGVLSFDTETKLFSFEPLSTSDRAKMAFEQLCVFKGESWMKAALFDRVFPRERIDAKSLLRDLGLTKYDEWEILKKTQLVSCNDMIWMSKSDDPNEFFECHPLAGYAREKGLV